MYDGHRHRLLDALLRKHFIYVWCGVYTYTYFRIQVNARCVISMSRHIILCIYKKDEIRDLNFKTRGNRKRLPALTPRTGCSQIRNSSAAALARALVIRYSIPPLSFAREKLISLPPLHNQDANQPVNYYLPYACIK